MQGWLLTVVVLAAALIGLRAWVIVDHTGGGGGSATKDAATRGDTDGQVRRGAQNRQSRRAQGMVAPNIVMRSEDNVVKGVDTLIGRARISAMTDLKVERIAPVTVNGDFAATFIRATEGGISRVLLSVHQIKDGKIPRVWAFDLGTTPPFDNAVAM